MSRRNRRSEDTSLDLLLDTITNALGGILFLTILLVLLTKASRGMDQEPRPNASSAVRLAAVKLAEREVEQLEQELEASRRLLSTLSDQEDAGDLQRLVAVRDEAERLLEEKASLIAILGSSREAIADAQSDSAAILEEAIASDRDLADARQEYERERAKNANDLPLPKERRSSKGHASLTIRYGRLYFERRRAPADDNDANLEDFFDLGERWVNGRRYRVVTPKPFAGKALVANGRLNSDVVKAIGAWRADRFYMEIAVWDDSFEGMALLREHLATMGYEYRVIPLGIGDSVYEMSNVDAMVQ